MLRALYQLEPIWIAHGRLPRLVRADSRPTWAELGCLAALGFVAAAVTQWWDMNLKLPGHAILRVVFPITLGAVLVPRRGAGATVGLIGMGASLTIQSMRWGSAGEGAMTSLPLAGLLLDWVATRARSGRQLYLGLMGAGLATNLAAFAVKASTKYSGGGARSWDAWWPRAAISYPTCGLLAGLICAVVLLRLGEPDALRSSEERRL